jgi:hypothetical protein
MKKLITILLAFVGMHSLFSLHGMSQIFFSSLINDAEKLYITRLYLDARKNAAETFCIVPCSEQESARLCSKAAKWLGTKALQQGYVFRYGPCQPVAIESVDHWRVKVEAKKEILAHLVPPHKKEDWMVLEERLCKKSLLPTKKRLLLTYYFVKQSSKDASGCEE